MRNLLKEKEVISQQAEKPGLPKFVHYPTRNNQKITKIPENLRNNSHMALIGETYNNKPYSVNLKSSRNILISGRIGYGKNMLMQNFLLHTLKHEDDYSAIGIDHGYSLGYLRSFQQENFVAISIKKEDDLTVLSFVADMMQSRKEYMESEKLDNFEEFSKNSSTPRIIVFLNDFDELIKKPVGYSAERQKQEEEKFKEVQNLLMKILGNEEDIDVGIRVIVNISMATTLQKEIADCFDTKIMMGAIAEDEPTKFFKTDTPTISGQKGEALIRINNDPVEIFQIYYSHEETFYEVIEQQ